MLGRSLTAAAILLLSVFTRFDSYYQKKPARDTMRVQVSRILVGETTRNIILVLEPDSGETDPGADPRVLALVIGFEEGRSIAVAFQKVSPPRPLSHDLMKTIIEEYNGVVDHCVITRMERETFFAELHLKREDRDVVIDCRPSDAIALSLRSQTPIFVRREVFQKHAIDPAKSGSAERGPKA